MSVPCNPGELAGHERGERVAFAGSGLLPQRPVEVDEDFVLEERDPRAEGVRAVHDLHEARVPFLSSARK